jgi:hypothetical protein
MIHQQHGKKDKANEHDLKCFDYLYARMLRVIAPIRAKRRL